MAELSRLITTRNKVKREIRRIARQIKGSIDSPLQRKLVREVCRIGQRLQHSVQRLSVPIAQAATQSLEFRRLRLSYDVSPLSRVPDTFVLIRIVGNDLPPRHRKGQSHDNIKFILDNEKLSQCCRKHWILNRINDAEEEAKIIDLLEQYGESYDRISFDLNEYGRQSWDLDKLQDVFLADPQKLDKMDKNAHLAYEVRIRRHKNKYAINNNGARNAALAIGRSKAKWILPSDGNCFLTEAAWTEIHSAVRQKPFLPYFVVPMDRITDNEVLLQSDYRPKPVEEPQIIFRTDAVEEFDEEFVYGRRPKVELLWRLQVPGPWDRFPIHHFDRSKPKPSPDAGRFGRAGWVARLDSGRPDLESGRKSLKELGEARDEGIVAFLDRLDCQFVAKRLNRSALTFYDESKLTEVAHGAHSNTAAFLTTEAERALQRGPYSVLDKTTIAPSGNKHDYWSIAPHWWPDPAKPDGLPYKWLDGQRVPGTELYEPGCEQFDRSSLQRVFDDTTTLTLAWRIVGDRRYLEHAALLVRTWFIEPATRMTPNLRYALVRRGHNNDVGQSTGIIEMSDIFYFLDAVRIVSAAGALGESEQQSFDEWLQEYVSWLKLSDQGRREAESINNHGTMFDLQLASIATFLGDAKTLASIWRRLQYRAVQQFGPDGLQPHEIKRTKSRHYCNFNLQGWANLARIMAGSGNDFWQCKIYNTPIIQTAIEWLIQSLTDQNWPQAGEDDYDLNRLAPLMADYRRHYDAELSPISEFADDVKPQITMSPSYAIAPYWIFARD